MVKQAYVGDVPETFRRLIFWFTSRGVNRNSLLVGNTGLVLSLVFLVLPISGLAQTSQSVWLSNVSASVNEGGYISFTVNRTTSPDSALDVTVNISPVTPIEGFNILLNGDDTDGIDVDVTIPANSSTATATVATIDDHIVNSDVSVEVEIEQTEGVLLIGTADRPLSATSRVVNNDIYILGVTLEPPYQSRKTIAEGDSVEFRFMRCVGFDEQELIQSCADADESSPRPGAVSPPALTERIVVTTKGDFFSGDNLFDTTNSVDAVTFSGGQFYKNYTITTVDDNFYEEDGNLEVQTFPTDLPGGTRFVRIDVRNDDPQPQVRLELSPASINEADDPTTDNEEHKTTVTASLNHASNVATTVTVSVDLVLPAQSSDYSISSNRVLTIAAGQTASTGTVTITAVDNYWDTQDKTLKVKGVSSNTVGVSGPADATLTIIDDDTRGVTISPTELEIDEGDSGTYTVVLDSQLNADFVVAPVRTPDESDVTVSGRLTFTPADWNIAQTVTVNAAPDSDASDDTAVIRHDTFARPGNYFGVPAGTVNVTVDDDETVSDRVVLSVSPTSVAESADATVITVTATLNGGTRDAETPVVVNAGSGTATSGTDFAAVSAFTITIPADTASHTGAFSLDPTQDTVDESDETVAVDGSTSVDGLSVTGAQVTITDDDVSPTVTLALSDASIGEDGGVSTVTASLDHASGVATTVTVSVEPNSPATSSDYNISSNRVLTIAAGETASTGTVTISAVDNDVDAADKTVQVKGSASNTLGVTNPSDVSLTLEDDDTRGVSLSASSLEIDEGGENTYTVVLDTEPTASVTVTPSRSSGDNDVTVSGPLTFSTSNWSSAQTVTVSAAQDADPDDDAAAIGHSVSGGDYASFAAGTVSVTVDDDEEASDSVTLTVSPTELAESASATEITVTATLNGGTRNATTPVVVAVGSGTATSGTDFAAVSAFTITIPANAASHTGAFRLDPTQDSIDEPDETVNVDGSTTINGLAITDTTVTITDDDAAPTVTLALSDASISENGGASTVTASLDYASSVATTVTISVEPDSPATSSDYNLSTNQVLTIAAEQTESTGTVTVTAVDNDVDATDKTMNVTASVNNAQGFVQPSSVQLTIEDDDTRGVTLSRDELGIDEGDSGTYTVKLDTEPTASVTVMPSRTSGDTDVTVSGALTFTTDNWKTAQTVTVSAAQDADPDDDAAVIGHSVTGGDYASFAAGTVSVTVDDDETASDTVTLTVSPNELAESAVATDIMVTATLNGGTRSATTPVTVNVGSGTATSGTDFAAVGAFTITIPANAASQTGTFSLDPTQDTVDEPDETVAVDGSTTVSGLSVTDTTVTITDDDDAPTVTLSLSDDSISEDGGVSTVTASLDHASSVATTVTISVDPDSPATGSDYTLSTNNVLTVAAGQTASTGTVTVTAVDNDVDAANKTVQVKGDTANTLGVTGPPDVTLTLEDDDTRGVTLSRNDLEFDEGDSGTYTVKLDTEPTASVTVTPSRSNGDTDVTVSGALTFTTLDWRSAQTVTVRAAQDNDPDDDTAEIGHAVAGGDYASFAADSVSVTVDDDETASDTVTLTVSLDELAESAAATDITVTATLNGGTRNAITPVTVNVASGTATSGTDFGTVTAFTITIPANTASQTGTFSLDPTQDTVDEPDETVAIDGSTSVAGISITDTTVKITDDDDEPTVTLALSDSSIDENGGVSTVTASLDHASSVATTVTISVEPDSPATSSDYNLSTNNVLTVAAGQTASTGTVTVTAVDNDVDAANKTVQVKGDGRRRQHDSG